MSTVDARDPRCVVVMGVSGVGKTAVARRLADRLAVPWADADDLHPARNIAKMSAGEPLDDADRRPWLAAVGRWLSDRTDDGTGGVIACSALARRYRDLLRTNAIDTFFLHLTAAPEVIACRMAQRPGHFMPMSLLESQLHTLEPLEPDELGASVDAGQELDTIVETALELLRADGQPSRET